MHLAALEILNYSRSELLNQFHIMAKGGTSSILAHSQSSPFVIKMLNGPDADQLYEREVEAYRLLAACEVGHIPKCLRRAATRDAL